MRIVSVTNAALSGLVLFTSDVNATPFSVSKTNAFNVETQTNKIFFVIMPEVGLRMGFNLTLATSIGGVDFTGNTSDNAIAALGLLFNIAGGGAGITPTLQAVTDMGNTTNNEIVLTPNQLRVQSGSTVEATIVQHGGIQFQNDNGFATFLHNPIGTFQRTIALPNVDGTAVVSVSGTQSVIDVAIGDISFAGKVSSLSISADNATIAAQGVDPNDYGEVVAETIAGVTKAWMQAGNGAGSDEMQITVTKDTVKINKRVAGVATYNLNVATSVNGISADDNGDIPLAGVGEGLNEVLALGNTATANGIQATLIDASTDKRITIAPGSITVQESITNNFASVINSSNATAVRTLALPDIDGDLIGKTASELNVNVGALAQVLVQDDGAGVSSAKIHTETGASVAEIVIDAAIDTVSVNALNLECSGDIHAANGINADSDMFSLQRVTGKVRGIFGSSIDDTVNALQVTGDTAITGKATVSDDLSCGTLIKFYKTAVANFPAGTIKASALKLNALNTAPATSTSAGTTGDIRITAGFIYVCSATNTWVRAAMITF